MHCNLSVLFLLQSIHDGRKTVERSAVGMQGINKENAGGMCGKTVGNGAKMMCNLLRRKD